MSGSDVIEGLNMTEKKLGKYMILSVYQDFENINMIKRILMASGTC